MLNVSVVIPHAGGREILSECLASLATSKGVRLETIIVNNGPVDDVDDDTLRIVKNVQILRYECNLGFAAACNRGVEVARSDLIFLLNNDAFVEPGTIKVLAERLSQHETAGACQPKIMSLINPDQFDYSSAVGGELDRYGFPFARGRVFETIETDAGQYDDECEIFWGAGAALMIKKDLYLKAGGLDEKFFAHMEEIDLLWRLRLMGYPTLAIPSVRAWHRGAVTIKSGSFRKLYYNHRNSLAMLVRNYSVFSLLKYLPARLILDFATMIWSIYQRDFVRLFAVLCAICWFWKSIPYLIVTRTKAQRLREVSERQILKSLYPKSIAWLYFIEKKRTWQEIRAH